MSEPPPPPTSPRPFRFGHRFDERGRPWGALCGMGGLFERSRTPQFGLIQRPRLREG